MAQLRRVKHNGRFAHKKASRLGDTQYRIGYFMLGRNGNKKGKWTWRQYCPLISHRDLIRLFEMARKEGTLKD
jgi:hypothetical protein